MVTILTGEEMRAYLKRQAITKRLYDNGVKLRNLKWNNDTNSTKYKIFTNIRNDNKQLLKQLREI